MRRLSQVGRSAGRRGLPRAGRLAGPNLACTAHEARVGCAVGRARRIAYP